MRDEGKTALLDLETGEAGTYIVGLYTMPRGLAMKATQFNNYLAHDGVPDTLAARKRDRELNKHVRALLQIREGGLSGQRGAH